MVSTDTLFARASLRIDTLRSRVADFRTWELRALNRVHAALVALGSLMHLGGSSNLAAREGTAREDLAQARREIDEVIQRSFATLRAQGCNASGDRDVVTDVVHDQRALDALVSILSTAFERLGVSRARGGEDPYGRQERQERDGNEEHEGEDGGASHGLNVRPVPEGEVSR